MNLTPLTYGQVKANKAACDLMTAPDLTYDQRLEAAVDFLHVSDPALDVDAIAPSAILAAAQDLYRTTFYRPEEPAPVQTPNP
jgi:hypothetical protein